MPFEQPLFLAPPPPPRKVAWHWYTPPTTLIPTTSWTPTTIHPLVPVHPTIPIQPVIHPLPIQPAIFIFPQRQSTPPQHSLDIRFILFRHPPLAVDVNYNSPPTPRRLSADAADLAQRHNLDAAALKYTLYVTPMGERGLAVDVDTGLVVVPADVVRTLSLGEATREVLEELWREPGGRVCVVVEVEGAASQGD